jgi:integrase/predicted RNA-binding Zn-ribbon protein involved in translation (DUF1610 family)
MWGMMEKPSLTDTSSNEPSAESIVCPECGSKMLYRAGLRYLEDGNTVQRWLCRHCGYRFTDPKALREKPYWYINNARHSSLDRQICALDRRVGNLAISGTRQEEAQREGTALDLASQKGKIVEFAWKLKNEGRKPTTISEYITELQTLVRKGANLFDPESVKETIAKQEIEETTKRNYVNSYDAFAKTFGINWKKPRYRPSDRFPFIPLEADIDQLIAGSGKKLGTSLLAAKETAMRVGEILKLQWTDIQPEQNLIAVNSPEKGSLAGAYKVSSQLVSRVMALPRKSERIFPTTVNSITARLRNTRRSLAEKLGNPILLKITFHTLRHWKGTMLYHQTRDPLYVQQFLRHKSIKNTMIYINVERTLFASSGNDEFHVKTAKTLDEACELLKVGFEYVTDMEAVKIFRKRK